MATLLARLRLLKVGDVMARDIVEVDTAARMAEAARTLVEREVSGAPAVDARHVCQGMLSAWDFVRYVAERNCANAPLFTGQPHELLGGQTLHDAPQRDTVSAYMSGAVQTISPDAPLLTAAREMCDAHLHRLPVLDESGRAVGIVTALDIVAALVNAAAEEETTR